MSRSLRLLTFGCLCSALALTLLSAQPQPISADATKAPTIGDLLSAETITIQDDWKGLSPAAIVAHYTLKRSESSYVGTGNFSVQGYTGEPLTATVTIDIPLNVAKSFLQMLMDIPLQTGEYKPGYRRPDDAPSVTIKIVTPTQTVTFFSDQPAQRRWDRDHWDREVVRGSWQVTIQTGDTTEQYVSGSTVPADALNILNPFLKRGVLEGLTSSFTRCPNLLSAETITIEDDSSGDGDPWYRSAHYTLKRGDSGYVGTGNFADEGYGGKHTATADIVIPLNVAQNFLQMLMDAPMQISEYTPAIDSAMQDYVIQIVTPTQTVTFKSWSLSEDLFPWQVTLQTGVNTEQYVSYSTIPADALKTLIPFLKRDVLEGLESGR
ncbi:MAG TPA: hypothetical protein VHV83_15470 [Armatimonadota bacterium]|nr:hypothetical protein [Armatimonadota bacterium]